MDYGESELLALAVKNVGIEQATNVILTLSTDDPYITFTDSTETYGNIDPEQILSIPDGFAFDVANDLPDAHYVLVNVTASGDDKVIWTSNFTIPGHAPNLELGDVVVSDPTGNNNGKLDPGETVNLVITIENSGSADAMQVIGDLVCNDPFITVNQSQMTYGDIGGENSSDQSFSITADAATPAGHMANFSLDISADLGISATGLFNEVIGQVPVLILDLDPNASSGTSMENTLQNMEIAAEYTTSFPEDLNLYSSVFVCLGIYSSNHVLSSTEGQTLADYLDNGGSLYMEGGDTWYFDAQTAVHSMFNINGTSDGSSDLSTVAGQTGTFTEGMSFSYSGENSWIDHIEPVAPAYKIFQNQSPSYGTGVAYDAGTYKTIGCSHEFGGLTDGVSPSTKAELMNKYLSFFGVISGTLAVNFNADQTQICNDEQVNFNDLSSGNIITWSWEFEGGDPATSTLANPVVTYALPGAYDVTLTISNGSDTLFLTQPDYIVVHPAPNIPGTPEGDSLVCTNYVLTSEYLTTGSTFSDSYVWQLLPATAGSIAGTGTTATVTWTTNWEGTASISVKGVNSTCEGEFSESFEVLDMVCTGFNDHSGASGIRVFPNPSNGLFSVQIAGNAVVTGISVFNMLNKVVYKSDNLTVTDNSISIDLSDFARGVYFVRIKTDKTEEIRKIIVQ